MAATKYTYSIADDTLNGTASGDSLLASIQASAIVTAVDSITTSGDDLDITMKDALSTGDKTILDDVVSAHDGEPIVDNPTQTVELSNKTPAGVSLVSVVKQDGTSFSVVSHDWCDKTTWYEDSTLVTDETLTDSGDGLTFNSANDDWIDVENGKIFKEYLLTSYIPVIKVDDVVQTSGYSINYATGDVTFDSSQSGNTVKATYYYAGTSTWTIKPEAGKILSVEHAELQFAKDCEITSPISFAVWAYNPADLPNKIKADELIYKNEKDIINSCNLGQGEIPAFGALTNPTLVFPFNYAAVKKLKASRGVEIRITIDGDEPLDGSWATVTFYCVSETEKT